MKEDFYIFLDIDGVLFDYKYIIGQVKSGNLKRGRLKFNPESINALNILIASLEKQYNAQLVISSTWRHHMDRAKSELFRAGLKYDKEIFATDITLTPHLRGREIIKFIIDNNKHAKYVIIDDERFDYDTYFDSSQVIKTNIFNDCLSLNHIQKYCKENDLEMSAEQEIGGISR